MDDIVALKKDKTIFCDFFGYSPESKILEYLMEFGEIGFTFNDVVTSVGLNRQRAYIILRRLLVKGIIRKGKKVKNSQLYKLNRRKAEVKHLEAIFAIMINSRKRTPKKK